jgi:hypothetical protein
MTFETGDAVNTTPIHFSSFGCAGRNGICELLYLMVMGIVTLSLIRP